MNIQAIAMEDVVVAVGLRKKPAPLISREPCERCADADTEADTGAFTCRESPSGIPECESYRAVREIEDFARHDAARYRRISDYDMRNELAFGTADTFSNALHEQGRGAEFDTEAFLEMSGCGRDGG